MKPTNSSGVKTASGQISTLPGYLGGIDVISPTTGQATITIYDSANSSTLGKLIIAELEVDAGMPSCNHEYNNMVTVNQGIYVVLTDLSGTSSFIVRYTIG